MDSAEATRLSVGGLRPTCSSTTPASRSKPRRLCGSPHNRRSFAGLSASVQGEFGLAQSVRSLEGLVRLGRIFELDASWKDKPPSEIKRLRAQLVRPHVDSFFCWVEKQFEVFKDQRGYTRDALGYARNQREVLMRFFDDGRLVLTNNGAERAIKTIALGRKAWLFCGSDDHARTTAALCYAAIASARLHGLDPEEYLRCLIRLVPLWPEDRVARCGRVSIRACASARRRLQTPQSTLPIACKAQAASARSSPPTPSPSFTRPAEATCATSTASPPTASRSRRRSASESSTATSSYAFRRQKQTTRPERDDISIVSA